MHRLFRKWCECDDSRDRSGRFLRSSCPSRDVAFPVLHLFGELKKELVRIRMLNSSVLVLLAADHWQFVDDVSPVLTAQRLFSNSFLLSIGPVAQYHENSKYYSAITPAVNKDVDSRLPHITVELPVYKESLSETM